MSKVYRAVPLSDTRVQSYRGCKLTSCSSCSSITKIALMKWAWDIGKQHCRWVCVRISWWCCRRHHSSGKLHCIAEWIVADVLKGLSFFIFRVKHCNKIAAWPCRWQHVILQNVGNYWLSDTSPPPGRLASSLHMIVWEYVWSALLLCILEILGSSLSLKMWFLTVVLVCHRAWPLPPHSQHCILHWFLSYVAVQSKCC